MIKLVVLAIALPLICGSLLSVSIRYTLNVIRSNPRLKTAASLLFWILSISLLLLDLFALRFFANMPIEPLQPYMSGSLAVYLLYAILIERKRIAELRDLNSPKIK